MKRTLDWTTYAIAFYIKNDGFCIENGELCIKMMNFALKMRQVDLYLIHFTIALQVNIFI